MARYGRLRLEKHPAHGLVLASNDRPVLEEVLQGQEGRGHGRRPGRRRHRRRARLRARQPQAGAAQARLARRGLRRLRRRRGPRDLARRERVAPARLPARRRGLVLARRLGRRGAALRGRQDPGRRGRDGPRPGDDADPGHQHRERPAVEGRADPAYLADRGRDRGVLRGGQGGAAGHDRDVPGADDQAEGRLPAPRPARRPRLGPDRLRRGAPAAGADLPDDRQPPGPSPDRPDRHPGARGRPRGRRVLPDRAQAVRRPVEGHRVAGLDRAGRLRRGAGHPARPTSGWSTPPPSRRSATGWRRAPTARSTSSATSWPRTPTGRRW